MKVLVVGGGFVNKGAEAMVKTVQAEIGARVPGASFCMAPSAASPPAVLEAEGIECVKLPRGVAAGLKALMLAGSRPGRLPRLVRRSWREPVAFLSQADATLDVSGYAYADPFGIRYAPRANLAVYSRGPMGRPYICMPQAWGPFSRPEVGHIAREACRQATLTFVRDSESLDALSSLFPRGLPPQVRVSPDIAFLFAASDPRCADRRLAEIGLADTGRPLAAVAPNMRVYERSQGIGTRNAYVQDLIAVSRRLLERGYAVLFVPHEVSLSDTGSKDDRLLCALLEAAVGDDRAKAFLDPAPAAEMKAVIGKTACVIGSRFHALVAALSQGIPCMALSWSHKYRELLKPFGLEKYAVESVDGVGGGAVISLFDEFIEGVPALKAGVESALPDVRRLAAETFDLTAEALQRR